MTHAKCNNTRTQCFKISSIRLLALQCEVRARKNTLRIHQNIISSEKNFFLLSEPCPLSRPCPGGRVPLAMLHPSSPTKSSWIRPSVPQNFNQICMVNTRDLITCADLRERVVISWWVCEFILCRHLYNTLAAWLHDFGTPGLISHNFLLDLVRPTPFRIKHCDSTIWTKSLFGTRETSVRATSA